MLWNQFGETVAFGHGKLLHTSHILKSHFCSHCSIGDDMSNLVGAIFIGNVFQNVGPSVIIKVDIDIRE